MAEQSNILLITRSLSTGSFEIGENATRDSSRCTVPHYLRPSGGSCHDLCKYGRRRAIEEEAIKKSVRKRVVKASINELRSMKIVVSGEKNKKLSPDAKSNVRASSNAKIHPRNLDASSGRKKKSTSLEITKEVEVRVGEGNPIDDKMSRGNKNTFDMHSSYGRLKRAKVKPSCTWDNGKGRRNSDVQTSRKMSASIVSAKKDEAAVVIPNVLVCKTARRSRGSKFLSPTKDRNRVDGVVMETSKSKDVGTRKCWSSLLSHSESTLFHEEGTEHCNDGTSKLGTVSMTLDNVEHLEENHEPLQMRTEEKSIQSSPDHLPYENHDDEVKYSGSENNEFFSDHIVSTEIGKEELMEEKQNNMRMETEKNESESNPNTPSLLPDDEETNNIRKEPLNLEIIKKKPLKGKHNGNLRNVRVLSSNDKYFQPVKFRSGKVMDVHQDSNIPKKLIFKRRRSSGNKRDFSVSNNNKAQSFKENNKTSRKSRMAASEDKTRSPLKFFKSEKGVSLPSTKNISWRLRLRRDGNVKGNFKRSSNKNDGGEGNVNITINLKHQDVQMKKDGQYLLNNVIEETTSKLVESRKSKVKALVGAFETVISLQERKPSLHTAT